MEGFKSFCEASEEEKNLDELIGKLPKSHQKLLKGFKFKYTQGNTLDGDDQHVGLIHKRKVTIAAPWKYSRSFVTLHEVSHLIWQELASPEFKKNWSELLKKTKDAYKKSLNSKDAKALDQSDEELFCMVYAASYCNHPPVTYNNKEWVDFVRRL